MSRSIRFDKSTADSSLFPLPINMAMSSALLNASFPLDSIFSLGRSSSAHDFMVFIVFGFLFVNRQRTTDFFIRQLLAISLQQYVTLDADS